MENIESKFCRNYRHSYRKNRNASALLFYSIEFVINIRLVAKTKLFQKYFIRFYKYFIR